MFELSERNLKGKKENLHLQTGLRMLFKEIIGQGEVKSRLLGMIREDRMPHTLMLYGPPGTGKRSLAVKPWHSTWPAGTAGRRIPVGMPVVCQI
jgi:predicted ATPase with chaperone activity